jgi:hypothetical protein
MTERDEKLPVVAQPAAMSFPNVAQAFINQGSGIQVGSNTGTLNFNFNGITPETIASLAAMFSMQPAQKKVSHAIEWASLSTSNYCLFVLENEEYSNGAFSIAKNRALQNYTPPGYKERYNVLTPDAVEELINMPCIFAKRNMYYGYTEDSHPALIGRIRDIRVQRETIKICFSGFQGISQQLLNRNIGILNMASSPLRNELDVEHWSIKNCNLLNIMARLGVTVE